MEYRLLGPVEIVADGVRRPLSGRRQELLLAAVVLAAGREVPVDHLLELLWDGAPPGHPEAALRSQVARLRRVLGTDAGGLRFGTRGYALSTDATVDVARFEVLAELAHRHDDERASEAAAAALRLWRSPALVFADRGMLQPAAVRLLERRATLIERWAELRIRAGHAADVGAELQALLLEAPSRETARGLLMEALDRCGRRTEALDLYRSWREALRERGLEPAPHLRDLEVRLLRDDITPLASATLPEPSPAPAAPPARRAVTRFIGRDVDVEQLVAALRTERVVTLVGPGGVGKTRLAWEVIRRIGGRAGAVLAVDLSAVEDGADLERFVAGAVGAKDLGDRAVVDEIVDRIGGRPGVLLLDNCEHVIEGVRELVEHVVARAPEATVLATSQRRLAAGGEWLWSVRALPTAGTRSAAVELFVDRARAASPRSSPTDEDRQLIQRICVALDGLPLGIEIAAAQTTALSLRDLEDELDHQLELEAPPAAGPRRHRTLRHVVEWSAGRLPERERRALERLSVFTGPFELSAARAVLRGVVGGEEVAACIVQLVDRNLLTFQPLEQRSCYRMLQSIRLFGLDRLRAKGALDAAQAAHARWALALAESGERTLAHDERATVERLDRCFDDLRAAQRWLVARDPDGAMRLVHALHPYAFWHGRTEVFRWAEVVAALDHRSPLRSSVQASVCAGAWIRGDLPAAEAAAGAALAAVADPTAPLARRAFAQAGEVALQRGDALRAVAMFDRARQLSLAVDDRLQAVWDLGSAALVLSYTGQQQEAEERAIANAADASQLDSPSARSFATFVLGELAASRAPAPARAHLEDALRLAASAGNEFIAGLVRVTLAGLAPAAEQDLGAAVRHYRDAVTGWEHMGAWFAQLVTLRGIVELLASNGATDAAATLYGAAVPGEGRRSPLYGADLAKMARVGAIITDRLGRQRAEHLASIGRRLSPDEVAALALRSLDDLCPDTPRQGPLPSAPGAAATVPGTRPAEGSALDDPLRRG